MSKMVYKVERWTGKGPPSEADVLNMVAEKGLSGYRWSNHPGDVYGAHSHAFDKIIFVIQGSITFGLPAEEAQVSLNAGDRLDLTRDTVHDAVVGPQGVACLEVHRRS
jgi:quercetin dioxygenase-like cupin family protein